MKPPPLNLKNSVEFFPSQSSGALRAAYTLADLARSALGPQPAAAGNPAFFLFTRFFYGNLFQLQDSG